MKLPTVTIAAPDHPDGRYDINQADFDPERHTLWTPGLDPDKVPAKPDEAAAVAADEVPAKPAKTGKTGK